MTTCPTCHQTIKPARTSRGTAPAILTAEERARLTDAEFRAYANAIGPLDDCEFFLRYGPVVEPYRTAVFALRDALQTRAAKPADRAALLALKEAARAAAWTPPRVNPRHGPRSVRHAVNDRAERRDHVPTRAGPRRAGRLSVILRTNRHGPARVGCSGDGAR